jgi:hypothetical protein
MLQRLDNVILFASSVGNSVFSAVLLFVAAFTTGDDVKQRRASGGPDESLAYAIVITTLMAFSWLMLVYYKRSHGERLQMGGGGDLVVLGIVLDRDSRQNSRDGGDNVAHIDQAKVGGGGQGFKCWQS